MLKIHHVPGTRSVRILWLVKELGLPHEVAAMPFDPAVLHGAAYLKVNPRGKVPAIDDDGFVLTESGAIAQYLLAKYGAGRLGADAPPGSEAQARFSEWLWFAEGTLMPHLGNLVRQHRMPAERRDAATMAQATAKAHELLAFLDGALGEGGYAMGAAFSAADIMLGYSVWLAGELGLVDARHAAVRGYLERLLARDAFRAALER
jgi:glutathione S-transferase